MKQHATTSYCLNESPPIVITSQQTRDLRREIRIVREDLLPGGTKQRAATPFLADLAAVGVREIVYASPFCGFAQLALALAAQQTGLPLTLFCERDPAQMGEQLHPLSQEASRLGARCVVTKNLPEANAQAVNYGFRGRGAFTIPLGLQHPGFLTHYRARIAAQLTHLHMRRSRPLRRLWLPVGSGTLAGIFRDLLPESVALHCVNVHVLEASDPRLLRLQSLPNVHLYHARESFCETSRCPAPVPSNVHYDAKLWSFIERYGEDEDVWWNVAR